MPSASRVLCSPHSDAHTDLVRHARARSVLRAQSWPSVTSCAACCTSSGRRRRQSGRRRSCSRCGASCGCRLQASSTQLPAGLSPPHPTPPHPCCRNPWNRAMGRRRQGCHLRAGCLSPPGQWWVRASPRPAGTRGGGCSNDQGASILQLFLICFSTRMQHEWPWFRPVAASLLPAPTQHTHAPKHARHACTCARRLSLACCRVHSRPAPARCRCPISSTWASKT